LAENEPSALEILTTTGFADFLSTTVRSILSLRNAPTGRATTAHALELRCGLATRAESTIAAEDVPVPATATRRVAASSGRPLHVLVVAG
jgi:hypothetical protein